MLYSSVYFVVTSMQLCSDESNKLKLKGQDWITQWGVLMFFIQLRHKSKVTTISNANYCGLVFLHPRCQLSLREPEYPEKTHGHSAG